MHRGNNRHQVSFPGEDFGTWWNHAEKMDVFQFAVVNSKPCYRNLWGSFELKENLKKNGKKQKPEVTT